MQQPKQKQNQVAVNPDDIEQMVRNLSNRRSRSRNKIKQSQDIDNVSTKKQIREGQMKLTRFLKKSGGRSNGNSLGSDYTDSRFIMSDWQLKKSIMEAQLKMKEQQIEKLKMQKQIQHNKYSQLFLESRQIKLKAKNIIAESVKENAEGKRKQKATINPAYGYFKQAFGNVFVQGEYLVSIKKKIAQFQNDIKVLQNEKKFAKDQAKQRLSFSVQFSKKIVSELSEQLKHREKEVCVYKQRLKIAEKESNCYYAQENWPLVNNRYQTLQLLGSGGFGQVYKCFDLEQNELVALKVNRFDATNSRNNDDYREQFIKHVKRQIQIQKSLNHPNIARLIDQLQVQNNRISFVLQYCSGPQLSKYIKKNICLQQRQARGITKQLVYALKYLYDQKSKIIHYDIKPSNIMFHHGNIKLLDFGLCKKMDSDQTRIDLTSQGVGTYWYLPPETFDQVDPCISSKVDIWSVGVIFFEMLYGRRPFGHGLSQNKIMNQGIILKALQVEFPLQSPKKYKISDAAKRFIQDCLKYSPDQRLSPIEAYEHDYMQ